MTTAPGIRFRWRRSERSCWAHHRWTKAPAFQPGRTWQKPVATPEQDPSTHGVFEAPALQGSRSVLQQLPQQSEQHGLRARCPVSAARWPQHSNADPGPATAATAPCSRDPTRPASSAHETPHADKCPHAQRRVSTDRWEGEDWSGQDRQELWRQEWRGESWGDWASRSRRGGWSWKA